MPRLKNERHELLAQNLAKGMTQSLAFEASGFRSDRSNASKYAQRPEIIGRVAELRAEAEAGRQELEDTPVAEMTGLQLMSKAAEMAIVANNPAALGQIGKFKAENDGSVKALDPDTSQMSDADLGAHCLPFSRSFIAALFPGESLPSDQTIIAAFVKACGADGFPA